MKDAEDGFIKVTRIQKIMLSRWIRIQNQRVPYGGMISFKDDERRKGMLANPGG